MFTQAVVKEINKPFFGSSQTKTLKKVSGKWSCKIPEVHIGEFKIVPLTSVKKLKSESYWMNNCCRDYSARCAEGQYGLFSIRNRIGERIATLGVINNDGYWSFDQCYGPSNENVLEEHIEYFDEDNTPLMEHVYTEVFYTAHEVVRIMNSIHNIH